MSNPTPDCYEDWSKRKWGSDPKGRTAERGFNMGFVTSETQAEILLAQTFGIVINAYHPQNPWLLVESIEHSGEKFNLWESVVKYRQTDSKFPDPNQNPLLDPPRLKYDDGHENVVVDRDANNVPILNSAGSPPNSSVFDQRFPIYFTIRRNERNFDPSIHIAFAGTTNMSPWSPVGIPMIAPGQAQCLGIMPTAEFQPATVKYVNIAYRFRAAQGLRKTNDGLWDSWKLRFMDQGKQGWYTDPVTNKPAMGNFCDSQGNRMSEDIRLDGTGKPLNGAIMVLSKQLGQPLPAIANPTQFSVDVFKTANAVFLTYTLKAPTNFAAFGF